LHLDLLSAFSKRPIYVADSDIPERHRRGKILPVASCHETISHSIRQTGKQPLDASSAAGKVYAQLLHPFADVFCLFAADLRGLREISRQVAAWLEKPQGSLMFVPGSRDAPRGETSCRYFEIKQLLFVKRFGFSYALLLT
jgi:hypothetical protein